MHPLSLARRGRLTFFALLLLASATGCPNRAIVSTAPPKPFAGMTINVAVPAGSARLLLERQGKLWAVNNGVMLVLTNRNDGDVPAKDADIIAFNPAEMGKLIDAQSLAKLPTPLTSSSSWTLLSRIYQTRLLGWGADTYAVPLIGDATILIYRADLFAAANRKPPTSWAAFVQVAKQFADERQKPSLPPLSNEDTIDREFFSAAAAFAVKPLGDSDLKNKASSDPTLAKSYEFHFDKDTGKPRLAEPGFVQALEWLKSCHPFRDNTGTLAESFANDRAVLGLGTLADLAALKPNDHPKRYAGVVVPAATIGDPIPYFGPAGVIAAVTTKAKSPEAAMALLRHLSEQSAGLECVHTPEYGAAPYRPAHLGERPDGWFNWGFDRPGTDALRYALKQATDPRAINAPTRLRVRAEANYRRVLLDGLRECLTKNADAKQTLQTIADQWEKLDPRPVDEKRDEYLRSLNLKR